MTADVVVPTVSGSASIRTEIALTIPDGLGGGAIRSMTPSSRQIVVSALTSADVGSSRRVDRTVK
ncbi:hypothetical protein [Rhodococcoides fascians]|uniref:hypothetical protein n=1 Tax=Rhodococcoides fascians TaxID=1828 RepID=UPI0012D2A3E9|nr:hypothetical protein [Rhodococcus fascians]